MNPALPIQIDLPQHLAFWYIVTPRNWWRVSSVNKTKTKYHLENYLKKKNQFWVRSQILMLGKTGPAHARDFAGKIFG